MYYHHKSITFYLYFQECFFGFYFENIKEYRFVRMLNSQECFFGFYFENIKEYRLLFKSVFLVFILKI
jgi:hypothetical protein